MTGCIALVVAAGRGSRLGGDSRLMGEDEADTLAALKAHCKELIEPKITEYRDRIIIKRQSCSGRRQP